MVEAVSGALNFISRLKVLINKFATQLQLFYIRNYVAGNACMD
jgi:hypothetical protein